MPVYVYERLDNGKRVELTMSVDQMRRRQRPDGLIELEDGTLACRNMGEEVAKCGGQKPGCWPMASWAAGVAPNQVAEAYAKSVKDGVPTEFTRGGDPIFTSRAHRARYLKTVGLHDRNGGYSD